MAMTKQGAKTRRENTDKKWKARARAEGFNSEAEMLCYLMMDWALWAIASIWSNGTSRSGCVIQQRLERWHLKPTRPRGGRNNPKGRLPKEVQPDPQPKIAKSRFKICPLCGGKLTSSEYDYDLCLKRGHHIPKEPVANLGQSIVRRVQPGRSSSPKMRHRGLEIDSDGVYGVDPY